VSLVTHAGEILDVDDREVFGRLDGDNWVLYPDEQCRKLTVEEVEQELSKVQNEMVRRSSGEQRDFSDG
jgi:hypothetical protein